MKRVFEWYKTSAGYRWKLMLDGKEIACTSVNYKSEEEAASAIKQVKGFWMWFAKIKKAKTSRAKKAKVVMAPIETAPMSETETYPAENLHGSLSREVKDGVDVTDEVDVKEVSSIEKKPEPSPVNVKEEVDDVHDAAPEEACGSSDAVQGFNLGEPPEEADVEEGPLSDGNPVVEEEPKKEVASLDDAVLGD